MTEMRSEILMIGPMTPVKNMIKFCKIDIYVYVYIYIRYIYIYIYTYYIILKIALNTFFQTLP